MVGVLGGTMLVYFAQLSRTFGVFAPQGMRVETTLSPFDHSGNGYDLTVTGATARSTSDSEILARWGRGYDFDGASDYLRSTNSALQITGDFSATCVFHADSVSAKQTIFGYLGDSSAETEATNILYRLTIESDGTIDYLHEYSTGSNEILSSTETISTGIHELTITRDVSTNTVVVYVDGVEFINDTYTNDPTGGTDTTDGFLIGSSDVGSTENLNGAVYELRIWDSLVDQELLDQIVDPDDLTYRNTPEGNELACWFMEKPVDSFVDLSGNNNHLTETGTIDTRFGPEQKFGGGVGGFTTSDYLSVASGQVADIEGDLTVAVRGRWGDLSASEVLFDASETGFGTSAYMIQALTDGTIRFEQASSSNSVNTYDSSSGVASAGDEFFMKIRRDAGASLIVEYNGTEVINTTPATVFSNTFTSLWLGVNRTSSSYDRPLGGAIYALAVWDKLADESLVNKWLNASTPDYRRAAPDNPIAHYEFNRLEPTIDSSENGFDLTEVSGPFTAVYKNGLAVAPIDYSGNGYNLTVTGATDRGSPDGRWGKGYNFDGTNDELETTTGGIDFMDDLSLTITFVQDTDAGTSTNTHSIIGNHTSGGADLGFLLRVESDSGQKLKFYQETNGTGQDSWDVGTVVNGTIHTVTVRRSDSAKTLVIYFDGVKTVDTTYTDIQDDAVTREIYLGHSPSGSSRFLDGAIYECRVWDSLVSQATLDAIVDPNDDTYKFTPEGTEVACWFMQKDLKGFAEGQTLDGSADYWDVPNDASLAHTGDQTILLRASLDSLTSGSGALFSLGESAGADANDVNMDLVFSTATDEYIFQVGNGTTRDDIVVPATAGEHTFVCIRDVTNNTIKLRIDGSETTETLTVIPTTTSPRFRIGSRPFAAASVFWDGVFHDLRILNRVPTADEITAYENGEIDNLNPFGDEVAAWGFGTPSTQKVRKNSTTDYTHSGHDLTEVSGPFTPVYATGYALTPNDFSGNGHHLTVTGATQRPGVDDRWGLAYDFDGTNDDLNSSNSNLNITGDLCITWVGTIDTLESGNQLIGWSDAGETEATNVTYLIQNASNQWRYVHEYSAGSNELVDTGTVTTGLHRITLRRDDSTKNVTMKVDGVTVIDFDYTNSPTGGTTGAFSIAHQLDGGNTYMDGSVYECRIWDSLVSQATLDAIVDPNDTTYKGVAEGTEVGYWSMNKDLTGFGHGQELDGSADYYTVSNDADFATSGDMTVMTRYKNDSVDFSSGADFIFSICESGGTLLEDAALALYYSSADDHLRASTGNGTTVVIADSNITTTASEHTVIVIRDKSDADELKLRLDGSEVDNSDISSITPTTSSIEFNIGQRVYDGGGNYFNGRLYDIIVLDRLPTADEIADYEAGTLTAANPPSDALAAYAFGDPLFVDEES